jgi:hypothetical protein
VQSLHAVAPPVEYLPAGHRLVTRLPAVAPVEHAYPGSHGRQSDVPPGLYLPGPHGDPDDVVDPAPHDDAGGAAQLAHDAALPVENLPMTHCCAVDDVEPDGHA